MRIAITVSKELDATDGAHRFVLLPIPRREFDASIALYRYSTYARLCKCRNNVVSVLYASSENNRAKRRTIDIHVEIVMFVYISQKLDISKNK